MAHKIYISEIARENSSKQDEASRLFALYHEPPPGGANLYQNASLDFVAGYLVGATFGRWNEFCIWAEMPERIAPDFKGLPLVALDSRTIERIYELTELDKFHVELVQTRR